jgi:hypothetical protein
MNSRIINELIEKANEWSYEEYNYKETGYTREQLYSQKLAKLIVLDCINLLVFHGFDDAVQYVRQHFGVKQ